MNHIAFDVPAEKMEEYAVKLKSKGVKVTEIINHANSLTAATRPTTTRRPMRATCSSARCTSRIQRHAARVRRLDPAFNESDVAHRGKTAADSTVRPAVPA